MKKNQFYFSNENPIESSPPKSYFASPERIPAYMLKALAEESLKDPIIHVVLESVAGFVLILNEHRQIIAANQDVLDLLGLHQFETLIGNRPGEALGCEHALEGPAGCGTSRYCRMCGAVLAMLATQSNHETVQNECHICRKIDGVTSSIDFRVKVTPIELKGHPLMICVLHDISDEKRREVLEKMFVHDLRNMLGSLIGWSNLVKMGDPGQAAQKIIEITNILSNEVNDHHALLLAEKGELTLHNRQTNASAVLEMLEALFITHNEQSEKQCAFLPSEDNEPFVTDVHLLVRILSNMIKNALEATEKGGTVTIRFERHNGKPVFSVHNNGVIPGDVTLKIFQRSFSTKSLKGRGLGTYSMKLFGENYLKGRVCFTSSEENGTKFTIQLP